MRKTIYVKSEEVWEGIKSAASDLELSVSEYLLNRKSENDLPSKSQLDRIEEKLDLLVSRGILKSDTNRSIREKKIKASRGKDLSPKISKSDEQMLKDKMEVIARKKPESLTGWSGGFSKEKQLGKKKN